jgi:hypothetical protein
MPERPRLEIVAQYFGRIAALIGAVVTLVAILSSFFSSRVTVEAEMQKSLMLEESISAITQNTDRLVQRVADLESKLGSLIHVPQDAQLSAQLTGLQDKVAILEKNYSVIETAVEDNPERAMSIPLIRKDLDNLRNDLQSGQVAAQQEIDRVYDQSKWVIGGIFICVLGLFAQNWFATKAKG